LLPGWITRAARGKKDFWHADERLVTRESEVNSMTNTREETPAAAGEKGEGSEKGGEKMA